MPKGEMLPPGNSYGSHNLEAESASLSFEALYANKPISRVGGHLTGWVIILIIGGNCIAVTQ